PLENLSPAPTSSTTPAPIKAVESNCVTFEGAHSYQNCPATQENAYRDNIQEYVSQAAAANYNQGNIGETILIKTEEEISTILLSIKANFTDLIARSKYVEPALERPKSVQNLQNQMATLTDMVSKLVSANAASSSGSGTLPGNTVTNPKEDLKGITTQSGIAYQGPKAPSKQETKVTKDQLQNPNSQNTAPVQPLVIQPEPQALVSEPVVAPVSASMPNLKPSIPYPSRHDNEKRRDQANEQIEKFYEIFKDMSFEISFTDALTLMPKFASTLKDLIGNKEKLSEMAQTTMNEHCSAVILNKLPRKLGDPENFSYPVNFPEWMSTSRALIDVHKGELTLRIRNEAITYNLDQTVIYSANYNQITANKIDVFEEYSQEVLGFSNVTDCGISTPQNEPIVFVTSPTLTPFGASDFLLFEEADAFLGLEDDPDSPKINPFYFDLEGDILLLEAILNSEPSHPLPNQDQNLPSFKEELKAYEA
nr:hypothetical protein [Tanacetum cinerariifolium]